MALLFSTGVHYVTEVDTGFAPMVVADGGELHIRNVECGDITVEDGSVYLDDVDAGMITMDAVASNQLFANGVRCVGLEANGGMAGQELLVNGMEIIGGQFVSVGTFNRWRVSGLVVGPGSPLSAIDITDLTMFYLQAMVRGSDQHGIRLEDCVAGDVYATILDPSTQTDNTYQGIDLQGVCDRMALFGSIRGAVSQANNPQYGVQIAAGGLAIDLFMAITGAQTGAVNDLTAGQVTIH